MRSDREMSECDIASKRQPIKILKLGMISSERLRILSQTSNINIKSRSFVHEQIYKIKSNNPSVVASRRSSISRAENSSIDNGNQQPQIKIHRSRTPTPSIDSFAKVSKLSGVESKGRPSEVHQPSFGSLFSKRETLTLQTRPGSHPQPHDVTANVSSTKIDSTNRLAELSDRKRLPSLAEMQIGKTLSKACTLKGDVSQADQKLTPNLSHAELFKQERQVIKKAAKGNAGACDPRSSSQHDKVERMPKIDSSTSLSKPPQGFSTVSQAKTCSILAPISQKKPVRK